MVSFYVSRSICSIIQIWASPCYLNHSISQISICVTLENQSFYVDTCKLFLPARLNKTCPSVCSIIDTQRHLFTI